LLNQFDFDAQFLNFLPCVRVHRRMREGTQHHLVALRQRSELMKCPQFIAFFERKRESGRKEKDFHKGKLN
jgi:hypothetical protein